MMCYPSIDSLVKKGGLQVHPRDPRRSSRP